MDLSFFDVHEVAVSSFPSVLRSIGVAALTHKSIDCSPKFDIHLHIELNVFALYFSMFWQCRRERNKLTLVQATAYLAVLVGWCLFQVLLLPDLS